MTLVEPTLADLFRRLDRATVTTGVTTLLTPRERQTAELAAQRAADSRIAMQLGLSCWTVRHHLIHLFQKLGAPNRATVATLLCGDDHVQGFPRPPGRSVPDEVTR